MASRTVVELLDDIDGGAADSTVSFALDGIEYAIDLSAKNGEKLRDALHPYLAVARRAGGRSSGPRRQAASSETREKNQAARAWLADNGYAIKDRGRIPSELLEAFESKTPAKANKSPNVLQFKAASGE